MCGRYALKLLAEVLELPFVEESEFPKLELPWEHYNVCPGTRAPVIDNQGVLRPALWGLIPHWSKEPPKRPLFNARIETAATLASFRQAWATQRCVVPTSGFYEWSDLSGSRAPYFVTAKDSAPLLWLAGLASYRREENGQQNWTYCVLTESSEGSNVQAYHHRVPVTLEPSAIEAWLQGGPSPGSRQSLATPYQVGKNVNSAAVNHPSNLLPVA